MVPVSATAYHKAGKPALRKTVRWEPARRCSACHEDGEAAPAAQVLSVHFGSWEDLVPDPKTGDRWLCPACAWAYTDPSLRRVPVIVHADTDDVETPDPDELASYLTQHRPLPGTVAVSAPLSGKRSILPRARWGYLVTDSGLVAWGPRHARWLTLTRWLRTCGFGERSLTDRSPRAAVLDGLDPASHTEVREAWRALDTPRRDPAMLPLLLRLSRGGLRPGRLTFGTEVAC